MSHTYGHPFTHIVSATALTDGSQLAMCGYVFRSYRDAVAAGHPVGNYLPLLGTLSEGHGRGVDCESCIVRHMRDPFVCVDCGAVRCTDHGWED
jgi:hypothetical protein